MRKVIKKNTGKFVKMTARDNRVYGDTFKLGDTMISSLSVEGKPVLDVIYGYDALDDSPILVVEPILDIDGFEKPYSDISKAQSEAKRIANEFQSKVQTISDVYEFMKYLR